ncbi:Putative 1-phosphatidylinositol-3-phosphate 5-kinase FAB1D [Zea mays]|uniref:Putative 1-phosphatidylinositol-3-phosphate 5-kinase FAB1D n=1 Tax=Zea mays TaxID=4577 RepID=A0A1D6IKX4_MAIZE|nr:Putative 1-phosphatidylinositol-3-phosphate 5-kinase FAB1D [Zea mays]
MEDEISSIIACALAISDERHHLIDLKFENGMDYSKGEYAKAIEKSFSFLSESSFSSSPWSSTNFEASLSSLSSFSSDDFSGYDSSFLLSPMHPEMTVNGKVTLKDKYSVTVVYDNQFFALRKKCCPSELAYITSLSHCKKWNAQACLPFSGHWKPNLSANILGIYQVKQIKHGKKVKIYLMVMENLLFGHNISRIYDLKDQNYVEDMGFSPIYIGGRTKHLLQRAIWNDTSFLTSVNVMDYSLLVGVDKEKHELVFGIIDYLRQYTWDKQLETWVKTSLVVPKNVLPTVISPKEFKKRFRKFMAKYFLSVPDTWSLDNPSKPCKSLGQSNRKLAEVQIGDNLSELPNEVEGCA